MTSGSESRAVLLHGFTGSARSWEGPVREGLGAAGVEVVAVDLPGHGADAGRTDPAAFTLEATLERIDDAVGGGAALAGYSMGGRLALHYALSRPERVHRLILESASPGLERAADRQERRAADAELASRIVEAGIESFVDQWEALPLFASRRRLPLRVRELHRSRKLLNDPRSLAASLRGVGTGALPSLWHRLEDIPVPTLLLVGAEDGKFVGIAERMAERMSRARLVVVSGAGHTVHLEHPDAWLSAVVDFLG